MDLVTRVLGAAAALAIALTAGESAAQGDYAMAKEEGKVTLYTGQPIDRVQKIVDGFKAKYPGIDVDFLRADTRKYAQRFESETASGRHVADAILATTITTHRWGEKFIEAYISPEAADYPPELMDPMGLSNTFGINTTSFAWNTDRVKEDEVPKTWDDLLDPKWKGKIGMQDPTGRGGAYTWTVTMYERWGEAKWLDYLQRLAAQEPKYGRYMQVREMVMSGEVALHFAAYPDFTEPVKKKGAPVDWAAPSEVVFVGLSTNLSKNAPNPNAGKLLIDYVLSDEGQKLLGETGMIPAKPEFRPGAFQRLNTVTLLPSKLAKEVKSPEFFRDKLREIFGAR